MMRRALGLLRVLGLLCLVQLGAALFLMHQAHASAERALERVGNWLDDLTQVASNEPTSLWLNGLHLWLASGRSAKTPSALLDDFESYCNGRTGIAFPEAALKRLIDQQGAAQGSTSRFGVVRVQNAERGIVACLDSQGHTVDGAVLAERARSFLSTGDLAAFGELRYFLVQPNEQGGSTVLAAWTQGSAKLLQMFPEHGDAPGGDLPNIPRPVEAQRQLSAGVPGKGHLVSYSLGLSIDSALDRYRTQLIRTGWTIRKVDAPHSVLALSGRRAVLVSASEGSEPAQSRLTLSEL